MEKVVLVDKNDNVLGLMEKQEAHIKAELHRAISVFLFNDKNELLLQQRALSKYHSPGKWTNTCCTHPRENESYRHAADRRLMEEMGISSDLTDAFSFIYKADVGQGLTEHELDHVFVGRFNDTPHINREEVEDWNYVNVQELTADIDANPDNYTIWFKIIYKQLLDFARQHDLIKI